MLHEGVGRTQHKLNGLHVLTQRAIDKGVHCLDLVRRGKRLLEHGLIRKFDSYSYLKITSQTLNITLCGCGRNSQ
jgi:hypothetical protein